MDRESFSRWLASYGRAWTHRDPIAAAALYTDDATYQVTPFAEPLRGRAAILDYWTHIANTEENVQFGHEILAVTRDCGIARWQASFSILP
jgi:ketosteroid isomerase-like protein